MHTFAILYPPCGSLLVQVQWRRWRFHHRRQYAQVWGERTALHPVSFSLSTVSSDFLSLSFCSMWSISGWVWLHTSHVNRLCVLFPNIQNRLPFSLRSLFFLCAVSSWSVDTAPMCDHCSSQNKQVLNELVVDTLLFILFCVTFPCTGAPDNFFLVLTLLLF